MARSQASAAGTRAAQEVEFSVTPNPINIKEEEVTSITIEGELDEVVPVIEDEQVIEVRDDVAPTGFKVAALKAGNTNISITGKKAGKTDKTISVPVQVTAKQPDPVLNVTPAELELKVSGKGSFTVETNMDEFTINPESTAIFSCVKKSNLIEVTGLRIGSGYLTVTGRNTAGGTKEKRVVVTVNNQDSGETKIIVKPDTGVIVKKGQKLKFSIDTDADSVVLESSAPEIVKVESEQYTVSGLKEGTARITFKGKAPAAPAKTVTVDVEVIASDEETPEEIVVITDEEVANIIKGGGDLNTKLEKIIKEGPLKYSSNITVLQSYKMNMSVKSPLLPDMVMSKHNYNLYYVLTDILEDVKDDDTIFKNVMDLTNSIFASDKEFTFKYELMVRYIELWWKFVTNIEDKDYLTYKNLILVLTKLADTDSREENKAELDLDNLLNPEKIKLSKTLCDKIKQYYEA